MKYAPFDIHVQSRGLLVLLAFGALMTLGLQVRWAIPAAMAIAFVDWLSFAGLFPARRR
jgi:hypothetical protein